MLLNLSDMQGCLKQIMLKNLQSLLLAGKKYDLNGALTSLIQFQVGFIEFYILEKAKESIYSWQELLLHIIFGSTVTAT